MKQKLSILFILVGIALSALADEVVFRAQAPAQVIVGRPFQLTYSVNQRSRDLRAPEFTDFDYLAGPYTSTSSSTSFVNGHRTSTFEQTYTYTLMAQKAGTFTIAPATIKVDGESVQSNGVRITVLPEDEQPAQSTPNNQNTQSAQTSQSSQGSNVSSENISLTAERLAWWSPRRRQSSARWSIRTRCGWQLEESRTSTERGCKFSEDKGFLSIPMRTRCNNGAKE